MWLPICPLFGDKIVLNDQLVAEFCPLYGIGRLSAPRRLVCIETMLKSIRAKGSVRYRGCPLLGGPVMRGSTVHACTAYVHNEQCVASC